MQQLLLKDDQYIPGVVNEDPLDLARKARVTATSYLRDRTVTDDLGKGAEIRWHELNMPRASGFTRGKTEQIASFDCFLKSTADAAKTVRAVVYSADGWSGSASSMRKVGEATAEVRKDTCGFVTFVPDKPIALDGDYVWVQLQPARQVFWRLTMPTQSAGATRAYGANGQWHVHEGVRYAVLPDGGLRETVDAKPEYVIDGVSRQVGLERHGWISDPSNPLPQALTLEFERPANVGEVRLTFDSDLTPLHPAPHPKTLVKAYRLEGRCGGQWKRLADVTDNLLRLRVHAFSPQELQAIRVTVLETWGDPSARIFEVRAYASVE